MTNDTHIAAQLRRARQQTVHRANFSKEVKEKHIKEKMKYYQTRLKETVSENDQKTMQNFLYKMIEVRAEQFALAIQAEDGQMIQTQSTIEEALKKYYEDCYRLQSHFQPLLNR